MPPKGQELVVNQTIMHEMLSETYATIFYGSVLTLPAILILVITVSLVIINRVEHVDGMKYSMKAEELIEECEKEFADNLVSDYEYTPPKYFDQIAA